MWKKDDFGPIQLRLFAPQCQPINEWTPEELRDVVWALAKLGTCGGLKNFFASEDEVGSTRKPVQTAVVNERSQKA